MSSLLITGGAGFIGSNLVQYALGHTSDAIVVVDKVTYAANPHSIDGWTTEPRVTFVQGDIADRVLMETVVARHQPRAILNLAAETHVDRSIDSPQAFLDTNVIGTFTLLEVARRYRETLAPAAQDAFRFLHVSTDEVYGSLGPTGAFRETTPYAPNSPYAASKAGADHLVRAHHETYGLPALITNCSNNYGPYQFPEKLIPLMTLNALEGKSLPIYGDGGNVRDWIYVEDHCRGVLAALQRGRPGEKYNLGGRSERTNLQIVDAICEILEEERPAARPYKELKSFVADRPGHDRRYAIDDEKARTELGWEPRQSFESGLRATVRWYLQNRAWCDAVQSGKYGRERLGLLR